MSPRPFLLLLTAFWLCLPLKAEAQCRKEIIVYLDISGSMRPTDRSSATSPFTRTVEALDALLEEEGFVGEDDVVKLRLFGSTVRRGQRSEGPRELRSQVTRLRQNTARDPETDFVRVVEDVESELSGDSTFDRRLVILASDFVHEQLENKTREIYLQDWKSRVRDLAFELDEVFRPTETLSFQFLVLPPWQPRGREADYFQSLQEVVLGDLGADAGTRVALDVLSPEELAKTIQASFLFEPVVSGIVSNGRAPELRVRVENQNCQSVDLERLGAYCPSRGGDFVSIDPGGQRTLAARGEGNAVWEQTISLEDLGCEIGDQIEVIARLEGDVQKRQTIDATNQLWARPTQGFFESSVFRGSLHLYLDLRGQILSSNRYKLELSGAGGTIVRGQFEVPRSITEEYQTYLFPLQVNQSLISGNQNELEVAITSAEMESTEIEVYRDDFDTWANRIFVVLGTLISFTALLSSLSTQQKEVFSGFASLAASWGPCLIGTLGVMAYDSFRASPLSTTWDLWLRWALLALCFGGVVFLWLRQRHLTRLGSRIEQLFESQTLRAAPAEDNESDMAAVNAAVDRVTRIVDMAGQKLRIAVLSLVAAVALAAVAWLALSLLRPAAEIPKPKVQEVIEVVQS